MKNYAIQLLKAVNAIHGAGICHRDLNLENLVLDFDFKLKIIDFGFACQQTSGLCHGSEKLGSVNYMAPEIIDELAY